MLSQKLSLEQDQITFSFFERYATVGPFVFKMESFYSTCSARSERPVSYTHLMISLHDESSNDGDVLETSFQEILQTPEVKKKTFKQRAKALNYTTVQVTKALFTDKQDKKPVKEEKKQTKQKKGGAKTSKD